MSTATAKNSCMCQTHENVQQITQHAASNVMIDSPVVVRHGHEGGVAGHHVKAAFLKLFQVLSVRHRKTVKEL